jgi:hypothetical protein
LAKRKRGSLQKAMKRISRSDKETSRKDQGGQLVLF